MHVTRMATQVPVDVPGARWATSAMCTALSPAKVDGMSRFGEALREELNETSNLTRVSFAALGSAEVGQELDAASSGEFCWSYKKVHTSTATKTVCFYSSVTCSLRLTHSRSFYDASQEL